MLWMEEPGGLQSRGLLGVGPDWATSLWLFTFTFHFHALQKEMATHSSVLAWRIPGPGEPGGLLSMGSHRVGHDWSYLAAILLYVKYSWSEGVCFAVNQVWFVDNAGEQSLYWPVERLWSQMDPCISVFLSSSLATEAIQPWLHSWGCRLSDRDVTEMFALNSVWNRQTYVSPVLLIPK